MFLKTEVRLNKDGSKREYLYLAKAFRDGKKVSNKNILSLGRIDQLAEGDTFENLARKFGELSGKLEVLNMAEDLEAETGTELGRVYLYRKVWERLGFGKVFRQYFSDKQTSFDISEAILSMVVNRLMEPTSKRDIVAWKDEVYEPKWEGLQSQHVYRAMDYLIDQKGEFERELYEKTLDLFSTKLDVVMFDTTSIMHWGDGEHSNLLKHGYSKDKRGDLKQIVVGVLMSQDGIPVAHEVFEGNQVDTINFPKMIEMMKSKYDIREVVVVCDKGMMSPDNLMVLHENGYRYILGVRLKGQKSEWVDPLLDKRQFKAVIRTEDKCLDVHDCIRDETIEYDKDPITKQPQQTKRIRQRYVVCYNPIQAKIQQEKRAYFKEILEKKIAYSTVKSWIQQNGYRKYVDIEGENITLKIDYERLKHEEKYDGMWAVCTNWFDADSKTIVQQYKGLRQVEDGFKSLKSDIEIGPMYHWTGRRIRSHVFICFLALILKTTFEKQLKATNPELNPFEVLKDIRQLKVLKLKLNDKNVHLRTSLKGNSTKAFQAIGAQIPPKFLVLQKLENVVGTP